MEDCVFCGIVAETEPASVVFRDDWCMGFMGIHPSSPGECMVIPLAHADHFTDLDEDLAAHLMRVSHRLARRVQQVFPCERVGFVVHGYGVPHAHLLIVPQNGPHDITSGRFARVQDGKVVFSLDGVQRPTRDTLDAHAATLAQKQAGDDPGDGGQNRHSSG